MFSTDLALGEGSVVSTMAFSSHPFSTSFFCSCWFFLKVENSCQVDKSLGELLRAGECDGCRVSVRPGLDLAKQVQSKREVTRNW